MFLVLLASGDVENLRSLRFGGGSSGVVAAMQESFFSEAFDDDDEAMDYTRNGEKGTKWRCGWSRDRTGCMVHKEILVH